MLSIFVFQCDRQGNHNKNKSVNTVTTSSGLVVTYLEKDPGPKIEQGSMVRAIAKIYLDDSLIFHNDTINGNWEVYNSKSKAKIAGAVELSGMLKEGDKVIALIPPSLAYGDKGRGVVYPKATLESRVEILEVGETMKLISATLKNAYDKGGISNVFEEYERISTSSDSSNYVMGFTEYLDVFKELLQENQYADAIEFANLVVNNVDEEWQKSFMRYQRVIAIHESGQLEQAIDSMNILSKQYPDNKTFSDLKDELSEKLKLDK